MTKLLLLLLFDATPLLVRAVAAFDDVDDVEAAAEGPAGPFPAGFPTGPPVHPPLAIITQLQFFPFEATTFKISFTFKIDQTH